MSVRPASPLNSLYLQIMTQYRTVKKKVPFTCSKCKDPSRPHRSNGLCGACYYYPRIKAWRAKQRLLKEKK